MSLNESSKKIMEMIKNKSTKKKKSNNQPPKQMQ